MKQVAWKTRRKMLKTPNIILGSFLFLTLSAFSTYAQEFTLTTTPANTVSSRASIDMPGLTGNPMAIIVATPIGGTETLNPHSIAAWYYNNKWNIFNTDQAVMPPGAKYKVQVFLKPDASHFLHVVTRENLGEGGSYIDSPTLNRNPSAQVTIFQNHAPDNRPYYFNRSEAKAEYDSASGRWYIKNVNGNPLYPNTAFNIVIISGGAVGASISSTSPASPAAAVVAKPTPTIPTLPQTITTPALRLTARPQTTKSIQIAFDNLNEFVAKGLPSSAALPTENLDQAAMIMAQQISKSDENSLPVLLTALQTAGFTIIDENGKVLRKHLGEGKGQGLGFYDFEAVGSLKLANSGISVSLEKIAGTIAKDAPQISAPQFAELMLQDLRTQADNSNNPYLRFWARLIIELGKSSAQPVDLMIAPASHATLSILQATLLTRRLQGDFYVLKTRLKVIGDVRQPFSQRNSFVSASWKMDDLPFSRPNSFSARSSSPCNLTGDEALILDASAVGLTTWNGWQVEQLGDSPTIGKISNGIAIANIVLAWGKLVAAVTMLKGEIIVQKPLPLIRTKNSTPGDKRLMVARIWQEVGRKEMLNCVRPLLNLATGLDFNLPTDGPLGDVAVEWHFAGDNETNLKKFVNFESPSGTDTNPRKQVTDNLGLSKMWLVGAPKIPAVAYQKNPMEIEKKAEVLVGVTFKSSKDFIQNWIDIGGAAVGLATGGPLGLLGTAAEIGYRVPWVAARATIPVIDHEPCDGQWQGTVTYTYIVTSKSNETIIPANPRPAASSDGGAKNQDWTITQSGTVTVNGNYGKDSWANSSADEVFVMAESISGKFVCSARGLGGKPPPLVPWNSKSSEVRYGGGNSQGPLDVGISLDKDGYQISLKPRVINGTLQSTTQSSSSGGCPPGTPSTSYSSSQKRQWGSNDYIVGSASYGEDRNILSGSSTRTTSTPSSSSPPAVPGLPSSIMTGSITVVRTITWNLRRCD
jgi:hypothetical protein